VNASAVRRGSHSGALPNMIVIGAAKCGTTSLHQYLDLHPAISMAREKELHYFSREAVWERGRVWYESQFDPNAPVRGEASVTYTAYPWVDGVPARMHEVVPRARLLYIEALVELEGNDLVERSRCHLQLTRYLEHFPGSTIHVLGLESRKADPQKVMAGVYRFLGVDPTFSSEGIGDIRNPTAINCQKGPLARALGRLAESAPARPFTPESRRRVGAIIYRPLTRKIDPPELDEGTRQRLETFLAPDAFRELTGCAFPTWCV